MSTDKNSYKVQIWVSIIGLAGVLGTALFSNWDKIFPDHSAALLVQNSQESQAPEKLAQVEEADREPVPDAASKVSCTLSGLVFDRDTNRQLSGVYVDLYSDLSEIQQRPKRLKAGVATTGPTGKFTINCDWVEDSQFPLLLAIRHRDWTGTKITGPKIPRSNKWDGINIPVSLSATDLKSNNKLNGVSASFSSKQIGSEWVLLGKIVNTSTLSFPCVRARFSMSTSYQDKLQGEPARHLGFLDVDVKNIKPNEKRQYQKEMPKRVGIGLHSIQEC